jgi:hypothetical protein
MNKAILLCLIPIIVAVIAICMLYSVAVGDYLSAGDFIVADQLNSHNEGISLQNTVSPLGEIGIINGRWVTEARVFNPVGKPQIYDTTKRSELIGAVIQSWAIISGNGVAVLVNGNK